MTTEKIGKYYYPKFTKVTQLTKETAAKYGPLFAQFVTSRKAAEVDPIEDEEVSSEDTGQVEETVAI
jgi:uncharacterized protein YecA (UPF0149 family)